MACLVVAPDKRQDDERPATHTARPGHPWMLAMHRISSLRRAAGAGRGGKQKLSRTGDKAASCKQVDDAMTTPAMPLLFLDLFRERSVLTRWAPVDRA